MATAYLGLGANLGEREVTLRGAVAELALVGDVVAESSLYETAPVGYLDQPAFLNGCVILRTELGPGSCWISLREWRSGQGGWLVFGMRRGCWTSIFCCMWMRAGSMW